MVSVGVDDSGDSENERNGDVEMAMCEMPSTERSG